MRHQGVFEPRRCPRKPPLRREPERRGQARDTGGQQSSRDRPVGHVSGPRLALTASFKKISSAGVVGTTIPDREWKYPCPDCLHSKGNVWQVHVCGMLVWRLCHGKCRLALGRGKFGSFR